MNAALDEARQLFRAATKDRTSLELLFGTGRAPHETLGFLAQQACEQFIKAVLVVHGEKGPRKARNRAARNGARLNYVLLRSPDH